MSWDYQNSYISNKGERMKKLVFSLIVGAIFAASGATAKDTATKTSAPKELGDVFTGDKKLACEAVLCLASATRPPECAASLKKYYSITAKKAHKQAQKRQAFLDLCPR